jgi:rhodanese-related sulfurtransferase
MSLRPGLEITPRDAKAKLEAGSLLLIDCRTQEEWDAVHVAGSVHIPLHELEQRVDEVLAKPGQQVAVLCHHGVRSLKGALALRQIGFPLAQSVAGGIDLWSIAADARVVQYDRDASGLRTRPARST